MNPQRVICDNLRNIVIVWLHVFSIHVVPVVENVSFITDSTCRKWRWLGRLWSWHSVLSGWIQGPWIL